MGIDDGEVIEVAARVKAVKQLTGNRGYLNLKSLTEALPGFLMKRHSVILIAADRGWDWDVVSVSAGEDPRKHSNPLRERDDTQSVTVKHWSITYSFTT
jgi:hypothetical protein